MKFYKIYAHSQFIIICKAAIHFLLLKYIVESNFVQTVIGIDFVSKVFWFCIFKPIKMKYCLDTMLIEFIVNRMLIEFNVNRSLLKNLC